MKVLSVCFSEGGADPGVLPELPVRPLSGSPRSLLSLYQRGRDPRTPAGPHRTQRGPHGERETKQNFIKYKIYIACYFFLNSFFKLI